MYPVATVKLEVNPLETDGLEVGSVILVCAVNVALTVCIRCQSTIHSALLLRNDPRCPNGFTCGNCSKYRMAPGPALGTYV